MPTNQTQIEKEAIKLVFTEKQYWENATVPVTDQVSFNMRLWIKRARKNYMGVFDFPKDTATGLDKIFVPLTEVFTDSLVKNTDLDTKDINLIAKKPEEIPIVDILRQILFNKFDEIDFGELLDEVNFMLALDGTAIVKILETNSDQFLQSYYIDLLNAYLDPSAPSLHQSGAFIERAFLSPEEIGQYKGIWDNVNFVEFGKYISRYTETRYNLRSEVPYAEVYERWGLMPRYLLTGKEKDKDEWIEGVIIVSGLDEKKAVVHMIMENPFDGLRPYEDVRLKKIPGRYYGRGTGEMLMYLQEYINEIVNTRRLNALLLHNQLFKVKRTSGITPSMISRLTAGGAIPVNEQDDIMPLNVQDVRPSSYTEEQNIFSWSQRVSQVFEVARGEELPATQPATTAVLQKQGSESMFTLIREQMGRFLKRLVSRHYLPIIIRNVKKGDIIRYTGNPQSLRDLDERIVRNAVAKAAVDFIEKNGYAPSELELEQERMKVEKQLKQLGKYRYLNLDTSLKDLKYDVQVFITQEDIDKSVVVKNLQDLLLVYSRMPGINLDVEAIIREILDLAGLSGERFLKEKQITQAPETGLNNLGQGIGQELNQGLSQGISPKLVGRVLTPQEGFEQANVPALIGR
jgi:hypothetical protein